jgi:hypothetical protein
MVGLVVLFLRLGWWQLSRAEGGNALSIGYTLEWPAFAIFVVLVWLREVRVTLRKPAPPTPVAAEDSHVPHVPGVARFDLQAARAERAARIEAAEPDSDYNTYLAWLAAHPDAKPNEYRFRKTEEPKRMTGAAANE